MGLLFSFSCFIYLSIRCDDNYECKLQIENTDGRICYRTRAKAQSFSMPVNALSNGIYIMTITTEEFSATKKNCRQQILEVRKFCFLSGYILRIKYGLPASHF